MKKQIIRHGEVLLVPCEMPKEAKLEVETNKFTVAHSETGHHHVLTTDLKDFKVYSWQGDTYIEVPELSELMHEKTGKEAHAHKIVPAIYKVVIKKNFDYFKKAMINVRD